MDRLGQTRVAAPTTLVSVLCFTTLIVAANQLWPVWTLFLSALLAAAMPSIPALVRARWTEIFRNRRELNTAFAFESAADELVYVAGASLSVGLSAALFPEAGMLVSTLLLAFGSAAFLLQRSTEPPTRPAEHGAADSAIAVRGPLLGPRSMPLLRPRDRASSRAMSAAVLATVPSSEARIART